MKKTFETPNDAYAAGYSTTLHGSNLWWRYPVECGKLFEPAVRVPGAFINKDDVDGNMPDSVVNELLINALNESLWDLEMGWRMQQAQDVLDNPEDYGLIHDMPEEDKKPLPSFLKRPLSEDEYETMMDSQEHSIPETPHADRAIQMLKDTKALLDSVRNDMPSEEDATPRGMKAVRALEGLRELKSASYKTEFDTLLASQPIPEPVHSYYEIYHPEDEMNPLCETLGLVFKRVCKILAKDINDAWAKAQNHNELYLAHGVRSTSVGDIIKDGLKYYMVMGSGFKDLDLEWASFDDVHTISFH